MFYALIAVILVLCAAILALCLDFARAKRRHLAYVAELQSAIVRLAAGNDSRLQRLRLSDEMREKLVAARGMLDRDLMAIQHDLVETLLRHNSLD